MIELPEAAVLAKQLNETIQGKKVSAVTAAYSPNKFAWYNGDPEDYHPQLQGKTVHESTCHGGMLEVQIEDKMLVFSDGIRLTFYTTQQQLPKKHQLLLEFEDKTFLAASIQMYGGIICAGRNEYDNQYYKLAVEKPSPISEEFTEQYFNKIISAEKLQNKSAKFVIATEQRIPGLGNGVLQDILFNAGIHPKRKEGTLSTEEKQLLYTSIKNTLADIIKNGGRDTEKDLLGNPGGYQTKMSKNTVGTLCARCSTIIEKASYLGGSVYFCSQCQKV